MNARRPSRSSSCSRRRRARGRSRIHRHRRRGGLWRLSARRDLPPSPALWPAPAPDGQGPGSLPDELFLTDPSCDQQQGDAQHYENRRIRVESVHLSPPAWRIPVCRQTRHRLAAPSARCAAPTRRDSPFPPTEVHRDRRRPSRVEGRLLRADCDDDQLLRCVALCRRQSVGIVHRGG
jgi:hypothetical protein